MTLPEIYERALALLRERGWCQGDITNEHDEICLVKAVDLASPTCTEFSLAYQRLCELTGGSVTIWNDNPNRTFTDVEQLLEGLMNV